MFNNDASSTIGSTSPVLIPSEAAQSVRPGRDYFFIQIIAAQAFFHGNFWSQTNRLVITSHVNLNHPDFGNQEVLAIQRSREVQHDVVVKLGLSPNLISLIPATMTHVSVGIDFILDKQSRLVALTGLINEDSFIAAISLAPGAAVIAKTIGGLAQKVITTFMPAEERQPILQFKGDFNIGENGLQEGRYAILGSRDASHPLPNPLPRLSFQNGELLGNGEPLNFSYVVLNVGRTEARGRERNDNALWETKLRQAEDLASQVARDRSLEEDQKAKEWENCKRTMIEARALLLADPNFTREEADNIYWSTWERCENELLGKEARSKRGGSEAPSVTGWMPDLESDRAFLDVPSSEHLNARLNDYAKQLFAARQRLKHVNLL